MEHILDEDAKVPAGHIIGPVALPIGGIPLDFPGKSSYMPVKSAPSKKKFSFF